jgi:hypothetical protein
MNEAAMSTPTVVDFEEKRAEKRGEAFLAAFATAVEQEHREREQWMQEQHLAEPINNDDWMTEFEKYQDVSLDSFFEPSTSHKIENACYEHTPSPKTFQRIYQALKEVKKPDGL